MIKRQILVFLFRWLVSSAGMWLVINWFCTIDYNAINNFWLYAAAGLVFSLVNSIVRPLATMFSLPLIILTMGIFTVLINVGTFALTIWLLPGVHTDFTGAFFGTLVMSIINGLVNFLVPMPQND